MEEPNDYILRVINLGVKAQNEVILENVSFKIKEGTTLAIVGPNGAGKSTLFRALLNLVPYTGKIEWEGKVRIGYVPQIVAVKDIPITVKEFLSYRDGVDIAQALSAVRLEDKEIVDKTLGVLSGGELRRVLIAWAIIDSPNVLLFDEPTTGVDTGSEESIFVMLNDLKEKKKITMLLITHDVHLVKEYTDQLLALNKCITFFGESKQLAEPALQQKIYGETICLH
jgi:ABC-type Mn2+/Zn2+ transport system ATPase subunit